MTIAVRSSFRRRDELDVRPLAHECHATAVPIPLDAPIPAATRTLIGPASITTPPPRPAV